MNKSEIKRFNKMLDEVGTAPPQSAFAEFNMIASKAFWTKYGKPPRKTMAETLDIRELLKTHSRRELTATFTGCLLEGRLNPKVTDRPFSIFISAVTGDIPSPKCCARCHIKPEYFGVYDFAVACGQTSKIGRVWLSERVTANWTNRSRYSARRAIRWLVNHSWLIEVKPRKKRKGWRWFEPVSHEDWIEEHGGGYGDGLASACTTVQCEEGVL